jgi:hypothetical protein
MDKPRRLAAIFVALSECETVEEYARLRDEVFAALPEGGSDLAKTVYDDLRRVFSKPEKPALRVARDDPDKILSGDYSAEYNPYQYN